MKETPSSDSSKAREPQRAGADLIMFSLMCKSYLPSIPSASRHHVQMAGTLISFLKASFEHESVFFLFPPPFPPRESCDKDGSIITLLDKNEYKFY